MSLKNKIYILIGFIIIFLISIKYFPNDCYSPTCKASHLRETIKVIKISNSTIIADIADTPETRLNGLSNRDSLDMGKGLLFIFENPGIHGFWMKDMKFSIDIAWINAEKQIVGIEKNVTPDTYPTTFYPPSLVKYVLETPAFYFDNENIKVGNFLSFDN